MNMFQPSMKARIMYVPPVTAKPTNTTTNLSMSNKAGRGGSGADGTRTHDLLHAMQAL